MIILSAAIIISLSSNGIIENANEAKKVTELASVKESAVLDILNWQTKRMEKGEDITVNNPEIVQQILNEANTEETRYYIGFTDTGITTPSGYELAYEELYNAKIEMISKTADELVVGDKVYYDTGNTSIGDEGIIECIVLYDKAYDRENGTNYGVQIISTDVIKNSSGNAVKVKIGGNGFNVCRQAYNNILNTLYTEAQKYLNQTYASTARCVGSDPADPAWDTETNQAGYYTKEIAEQKGEYYSYMDNYYGTLKNMDEKYITDYEQLDVVEGAKIASDYYWLATRYIWLSSEQCAFKIRMVNKSGNLSSDYPCLVRIKNSQIQAVSSVVSSAFRPVFTLNDNVIANKVKR